MGRERRRQRSRSGSSSRTGPGARRRSPSEERRQRRRQNVPGTQQHLQERLERMERVLVQLLPDPRGAERDRGSGRRHGPRETSAEPWRCERRARRRIDSRSPEMEYAGKSDWTLMRGPGPQRFATREGGRRRHEKRDDDDEKMKKGTGGKHRARSESRGRTAAGRRDESCYDYR